MVGIMPVLHSSGADNRKACGTRRQLDLYVALLTSYRAYYAILEVKLGGSVMFLARP